MSQQQSAEGCINLAEIEKMRGLNNTFSIGIELEFGFWIEGADAAGVLDEYGFNINSHEPTKTDEILRGRYVVGLLDEAGIFAYQPSTQRQGDRRKGWLVEADSSVQADYHDPNNWTDKKFVSAEISSPPMNLNKETFGHIKKVLDVLNSIKEVCTPSSTGFHVHFGRKDPDSDRITLKFDLRTLKNLASIVTVGAFQLAQLHGIDRVWSEYAILPLVQFGFDHPAFVLKEIESVQDKDQFLNMMHVPPEFRDQGIVDDSLRKRYLSTNFLNVEETLGKSKTIEFRGHQGTLDFGRIARWILTLSSIVDIALWSDGTPMMPLLPMMGLPDGSPPRSEARRIYFKDTNVPITAFYNTKYNATDLFRDLGIGCLNDLWKDDIEIHDMLTAEETDWLPTLMDEEARSMIGPGQGHLTRCNRELILAAAFP